MSQLGAILVDVGGASTEAASAYLAELRDRLGQTTPLDVRGTEDELKSLPEFGRSVKPHAHALAIASARAVDRGHLLVVFAPILPEPAIVQGLIQAFDLDEMVGFVQPRFSDAVSDDIWALPGTTDSGQERLPRQTLSLLPENYLTGEHVAACVAIRREVAAGISLDSQRPENLVMALLQEMRAARRRGYRNLILNRLVVPSPAPRATVYPLDELSAATGRTKKSPKSRSPDEWFDGGVHKRRELLVAKARRARPNHKIPILLDCRGAQAQHNGTSEAIFGLLDGLRLEKPEWQVDLLFTAEAAAYHQVLTRFPGGGLRTTLPNKRYAVAVRMNQPWHLSTVKELHDRALALAFNILDTIAWDVVYLANPGVDKVWHFISEHADGLFYNSAFTKDRFNFRFPVAPSVHETVTHHSLRSEEYRHKAVEGLPVEDRVLVLGNHYDHKAVTATVDILSRAFPFQSIHAMGVKSLPLHNVTTVQSGHLSAIEIDRLISTARVIVFPSYYEGFGFPVVIALAYGRTVVVRSSSLWREIAGLMRPPGHLVEFVTAPDLVEAVGKVLAGQVPKALPLGDRLADGEPSPAWRQCAGHLVDLVESSLVRPDAQRWYARDRALAQTL